MADITKQYLDYTGLQTLVTNIKKTFIKDASLSVSAGDSSVAVTLNHVKGDGSTGGSSTVKFAGGDGVKVSYSDDSSLISVKGTQASKDALGVVKLADSSTAIKDASAESANKDYATTAYAVKDYVDAQIAGLSAALEFKGEINSSNASTELTAKATSMGDVYVATGNKFTYNNVTLENGDLAIVKEDAAADKPSEIIVVERNLDGAVTAAEALGDGYVVLGSGDQKVKKSTVKVGADASSAAAENTLATEKWVEGAIQGLDVTAFQLATAGDHKLTIKQIQEVDGKISATDTSIAFEDTHEASKVSVTKIGELSDSSLNVQDALEYVYNNAGVTSFGGKKGEITVDTAATADGSVKFAIGDDKKLTASVVYSEGTVTTAALDASGILTFYNVKQGTTGKIEQDASVAVLEAITKDDIEKLF